MTRTQALTTIRSRLRNAGIAPDEAQVEARVLLQRAAGLRREDLILDPEAALSPDAMERLQALVQRRERREPLAYILGERDFYGMTFQVTPAVLIPRPETELLVELALRYIRPIPAPRIVDIGTGSGCIAVAIAKNDERCQVDAVDISPAALDVARQNIERHGLTDRVHPYLGDLFASLPPDRRYHVIVSNPPYIAPPVIETLEPEVRDFEPRIALGENADDLHFYRRLAAEARPCLQGILLAEVGLGQAGTVAALWEEAGYDPVAILPDLAGIPRAVVGRYRGISVPFPFASD